MRDQLREHIVILRAVVILGIVPGLIPMIAAQQIERRAARYDNLLTIVAQGNRAIGVTE
jgi:hypothetical protein